MVYHFTYGFNNGGLEHLLLKVLNNRSASDKTLIVLTNQQKLRYKLGKNIKVITLSNFKQILSFLSESRSFKKNTLFYFWSYPTIPLSVFFRIFGPTGLKIIWNIHSRGDFLNFKSKSVFYFGAILSRIIPDKILFASRDAKTYHQKFCWSHKNSQVLHHGLTDCPKSPKVQNPKGKKLRFGSIGRNDPIKNHHAVISAIANLPDELLGKCEFNFFGVTLDELLGSIDTKKYQSLSKIVMARGIVDDADEIFEEIDILIIHSISEAMPLVFLEAVQRGKVVFSTIVGDIKLYLPKKHLISGFTAKHFLIFFEKILRLKRQDYTYLNSYYEKLMQDHNASSMLHQYSLLDINWKTDP